MKIAAVIVAAGRGLRLGGDIPKQYQDLAGRSVLARTTEALLKCDRIDHVVCVIGADADALYRKAMTDITDPRLLAPVHGGADRASSVLCGLTALKNKAVDRVLIHDAARPFVGQAQLTALCQATGGAILAEPVVDALWREADGAADCPVPRDGLWRAQTPQAFPYQQILDAHQSVPGTGTDQPPALDDTGTFRRAGGRVELIPGNPDNFKITTTADMVRARRQTESEQTLEYRTGQGFDVHRFTPGDGVWLCGVHIAHTQTLDGHSDADVGLHALADALYGALAEGDIGRHFPPTDPQWKGAESAQFLAHAADLVKQRDGRIINTDLTLLCEAPKISPHAEAMQSRLAEIMSITAGRISIKATTMERMGFIGREEGIGCMATATITVPVSP